MYNLYNGDCLEVMDKLIEQGVKVDAIICDPPYGTTACKWDSIIPLDKLWERLIKLTKGSAPVILFGAEPFSSLLRNSNLNKYKYDWYWIKNNPTGFGFAKYQPMRDVENIIVFQSKTTPVYKPQGVIKLAEPIVKVRKRGQQGEVYDPRGLTGKEYKVEYTNYPKNTLFFKPQRQGFHPTQKPVDLLEYLINTYTNEGETVLDFTMGSGSTGVACMNTNRNFIGIELDKKYFDIAEQRIKDAVLF